MIKTIIFRHETQCADAFTEDITEGHLIYYNWKSFCMAARNGDARIVMISDNALCFETTEEGREDFLLYLGESTSIDFKCYKIIGPFSDKEVIERYHSKFVSPTWIELFRSIRYISDGIKEAVTKAYEQDDFEFVYQMLSAMLRKKYTLEVDSLFAKLPQNVK